MYGKETDYLKGSRMNNEAGVADYDVDCGSVDESPKPRHEVKTFIESWAGHFGSSQEREDGVRQIEFREDLGNLREHIGLCLEAVSAFPILYMSNEGLSFGQRSGLSIIAEVITEAAQKTFDVLEDERRNVANRNRVLRSEINSIQCKNAELQQQKDQAERAAAPDVLKKLRSTESTLDVCVSFFDAIQEGRQNRDVTDNYNKLIARLRRFDVSPHEAADIVTGVTRNAASDDSGHENARQLESVVAGT